MSITISERDRQLLREKFPDDRSYEAALRRLNDREPLAYLLGEWYFYDEVYEVSPACLIPRPETEHLVEELIRTLPRNAVFADLCTGSGCIAVSVLAHRSDVSAVAVDLSKEALTLAERNALRNGVAERVCFLRSDILKENPLKDALFDAIVSNPPYIATEVIETLAPEVKREPRIALDGGEDGLLFYRRLFDEFPRNLKEDGFLLCEIGYDQGAAMRELFGCTVRKDYSGNDRVARRAKTISS